MVSLEDKLEAIVNSGTSLTDLMDELMKSGYNEVEFNHALSQGITLNKWRFETKDNETYLVI